MTSYKKNPGFLLKLTAYWVRGGNDSPTCIVKNCWRYYTRCLINFFEKGFHFILN